MTSVETHHRGPDTFTGPCHRALHEAVTLLADALGSAPREIVVSPEAFARLMSEVIAPGVSANGFASARIVVAGVGVVRVRPEP